MTGTDKSIDNAIVNPKTYAHVDEFHRLFTQLLKEEPARWTEPDGFRPFWPASTTSNWPATRPGWKRVSFPG